MPLCVSSDYWTRSLDSILAVATRQFQEATSEAQGRLRLALREVMAEHGM